MAKSITLDNLIQGISFQRIAVGEISGVHPALEHLMLGVTNLEYCLADLSQFSINALNVIVACHPILVTRRNDESYWCISGIRSYLVAQVILDDKKFMRVGILDDDLPAGVVKEIGESDFYLSPLLLSLRPEDSDVQLTNVWMSVDPKLRKKLTPALANKQKFATGIGTNKRYFSRTRS